MTWHNRNIAMKNALLLAFLGIGLAGCAHKKHARIVPPPPPPQSPAPAKPGLTAESVTTSIPAQPKSGDTQTGIASWYGHPYHGRQAADGETYDMETLVAAHRTLPFQTWVRVINLRNDKTVEVRIIDRGPFIEGRIIDLSHAAARAIDLIGPGVGPVRIEVIRPPGAPAETAAVPPSTRRTPPSLPPPAAAPVTVTPTPAAFAVQVGVFLDRPTAERIRAGMATRYGSARIVRRESDREMWRVLVGSEPTEAGATALSDRISRESGERNAFVVRLDS
jgi:rare lipoprotein A